MTSIAEPRRVGMTRNRVLFLIGLVGVLAIGGAFASLTAKALWVRSVTSSVFTKYVIDQKIGHAEVADDASGFQGDFCVLHVNQPIPKDQLEQQTLNLMYHYHDLDGGRILSIQYNPLGTGKKVIESDAVYDANTQTVTMTLNEGSQQVIKQQVDWEDTGDAS